MKPYVHAAGAHNRITKALRHTGDDKERIQQAIFPEISYLLQENGDLLLQEDNSKIIL